MLLSSFFFFLRKTKSELPVSGWSTDCGEREGGGRKKRRGCAFPHWPRSQTPERFAGLHSRTWGFSFVTVCVKRLLREEERSVGEREKNATDFRIKSCFLCKSSVISIRARQKRGEAAFFSTGNSDFSQPVDTRSSFGGLREPSRRLSC